MSSTLRAGTASKLNSAYWSASTFGNDQFAQARPAEQFGKPVRAGNSRPAEQLERLFPLVRELAQHGVFVADGQLPSSWTQLKQSGTLTVYPSTDVWKIQAVGSTISGYQNGNLVVQATDTNITSGSPGVWLYYASNQIDNWSGGDVTAPTTYSVGGTVSGLSGTVGAAGQRRR